MSVTITNAEQGLTRTVITDEGGRYRAPLLPLGTYRVRAELAGFEQLLATGVTGANGMQQAFPPNTGAATADRPTSSSSTAIA